jgi:hypothetical protein
MDRLTTRSTVSFTPAARRHQIRLTTWVETKTTLVRTQSGVELDAVAAVDLDLSHTDTD